MASASDTEQMVTSLTSDGLIQRKPQLPLIIDELLYASNAAFGRHTTTDCKDWQPERIMQKMGSDHKPGKKNDVFHQQCDVTSPNCTQIIIIIVVGICQPRETMELEYSFLSFAVTGVTGKSDVGVAVPSTLGIREVCCWSFCLGASFSTLSFYLSLLHKWPFEAEQSFLHSLPPKGPIWGSNFPCG